MKEYFCNPKMTNNDLYEILSNEMPDFYQYSQTTSESNPKEKKDNLFYVSMRGSMENKENKVLFLI